MTTTAMKTFMHQASTLGVVSADAYSDEFGLYPAEDGTEKVGDWDTAAWEGAWSELVANGATDTDHAGCLAAWRAEFWA